MDFSDTLLGDFNGDGKPDLAVANLGSNTVSVLLGNGDGTFQTQVTYATGSGPANVAVGDVNGDGKADLIVTNTTSNTVSVRLGNGNGTFQTQVTYATGAGPNATVIGDFNGDGNPDLAVANYGTTTASVLLNLETRTATASISGISIPGSSSAHLVDAAYPGDANFITSTSSTTSLTSTKVTTALGLTANPVASLSGQSVTLTATLVPSSAGALTTAGETITFKNGAATLGTGTLAAGMATLTLTTLPAGADSLTAVYAGDTNFLASTSSTVTATVAATTTTTLTLSSSSVATGTAVTFTAAVSNGANVTTGTVTFCDATQTFCLNSAVIGTAQLTSAGTAVIKLVPGIGSHSYKAIFSATAVNQTSTSSTQTLTVTGTHGTTTAISSSGSAGNYTLTGTVVGAGSVTAAPTGTVSFLDTSNGNIVIASASLGVGTVAQTFASQVTYATGATPYFVAAGDFNRDGKMDLAVVNLGSNTVSIFLGNGDGTFQTQVTYATGTGPRAIAVGDFNGDGKLDLAVVNQSGNTVSILLGNGDGTFQTQVTYVTGAAPTSVAAGDFNGDGKLDLAVANQTSNTIGVFLGNGDGTFQTQVTYATGSNPRSIAAGDFNGDGKLDLVVANFSSNTVGVFLGNGDGTFQTQATYATGLGPQNAVAADLNADGKLDLAVANNTANTVSILLGNGDGTFQSQVAYATGASPFSAVTADINGDGKPDLVVTNSQSTSVGVLLGNGDGTFQTQVTYATGTGTNPIPIAVADFNGDGYVDLAVGNQGTNTLGIFLNLITQTATAVKAGVAIPGTGTTHLVDASYAGDSNFGGSTSSTTSLTSSAGITTLVLTGSPTETNVGGSVTLSAALSPFSVGSFTTTGETITFKNGSTTLGTGTLNSSGVATLTLSSLPAGTDSLTAVYGGDPNFLASTSPVLNFIVRFATTTTLALSSSSVSAGTAVTFTASVSNGSPVTAGTVTFCDATQPLCENSAVIGSAQLTSAGAAVIKLTAGIGSHSYKAVFNQNNTNVTSTSTSQSLTVTGTYASTTAITSSGSAGNYTLTGTVVGKASLSLSPTGSVSFVDTSNGNLVLGSAALGSATLAQTFAAQVTYATGSASQFVATGDFNGDGKPDLAVTNNGGATVGVLLGNGDGTFQPQVTYAVGTSPTGIAVGDFNGDGKLDLVVVNNGGGTVSVLLGNGDGTFQSQVTYATAASPLIVAVGDFNGDGKADLAVTNQGSSNTVGILLGNGDGTFQSQVTYATGTAPRSVAVGDFNGDGRSDLAVTNQAGNTVSILLGNGDGTFQTQVTYATGTGPTPLAIGDFNGDGKPDLVVGNFGAGSGNTVSVLLGNGDGTFQAQVTYAVGNGPRPLAVGDFNGDGKLDLAVGNNTDNTVSILLGNGNGTFQSQVTYATGNSPYSLAVGDFNGDGFADLSMVNNGANNIGVLLDSITQTATVVKAGVAIPGSTTAHLVDAVYAGDTNFAGSTSSTASLASSLVTTALAISATPTSNSLLGQSVVLTATLSPASAGSLSSAGETIAFNTGLTALGTGALNASGVATLTLSNLPAGLDSLTAVYAGDSNFLASTSSPLSFIVRAVTTTTLTLSSSSVVTGTAVTLTASVSNGSPVTAGTVTFCDATQTFCLNSAMIGTAQLTSAGTAAITLVPAIGSHSYQAFFAQTNTNATSASSSQSLAVTGAYTTTTAISSSGSAGNYTLTGTVVGTGSVSLSPTGNVSFADTTNGNFVLGSSALGAGTFAQTFASQVPYATGTSPLSGATGDFNRDGKMDFVVGNNGTDTVSVLLGNGDGTFQSQTAYTVGSSPRWEAVADLNGDGKLDLVVANRASNTVSVLLGNGDGTFQTQVTYATGTSPFFVAVGDFNGDGKLDLAVANNGTSTVGILLGNGDGTFQAQVTYATGSGPLAISVGDFNGDGKLDLAVTNSLANTVSILLGNGDGTFHTQVTYATGNTPTILAAGDFNGDGKLDLAVANEIGNTVGILLGNGDGTFQAQITYATGSEPFAISLGDFNGDGKIDLAVSNVTSNTVSVLLGNGDGTFQSQTAYATGTAPRLALVGDFNGDGLADMAVVNQTSATVSVLLNNVTQTATAALSSLAIRGAGTAHLIDANYAGDTNFSTSTSSTLSLTSSQVTTSLALTTVPANSSTYGQSVVLTATLNPSSAENLGTTGETVTFKNGSTTLGTGTLNSSGVATLTLTSLPAGSGSLTALYTGDTNFVASTSSVLTFTVSKAILTVTAQNANSTYGAANPTLTAAYTGFVNGDAQGVLTGSPSLTTTETASSPVGAYAITAAAGTLSAANYSFTFVSGTLTINPAVLTVTAQNASKPYGAANPVLTAAYTGFTNGDNTAVLTGSPSLTTTATASSPVGAYTITAAVGTLTATNYSFTFVNGTLTVNQAVLTVTAQNASKTYGAANPAFTASYTGFMNGDTAAVLTGVPSLTTTATAASPVNTYVITAAVGTLAATNYSFTFVSGTLTVNQAVLTVTAQNTAKTYGAANPAFAPTYNGFVNGDTTAVLTGAPSLTTTATAASPVNTYAITAAVGTLAATNYSFSFVNGTLTVNQAVLTVTAQNASKTYGAANPAFTPNYTGFVNGDTTAVLTGAPSLTTTATAASPVNTYVITAAVGTLTATNYSFTFVNGTLTVNQAVLTVTAQNASKTYGAANPAFAPAYTGFVNGDTTAVLTGAPSLTTTATAASPVNTYVITAAVGTLTATNYSFTFVNGTLTVNQAVLTVTAQNASKTYGAANPAFAPAYTGFVNGDTTAVLTGAPSLTTTATAASPANTYTITAVVGTLAATNYSFTFANGTLTVNQAVLTVTAQNASKTYGAANPAFAPAYTGFVNGDTTAVLTGAPSLTTTATAASPANTYTITAAVGALAATNYSFMFVNGTLTVSQAVLTVTAQNASKSYGSGNPALAPIYTGFVNGDTAAVLTGAPILTTSATAASPVNAYTITAALGTLTAANYSFTFVNGTLTVNQTVLTITAQDASKAYGSANPVFTVAYGGFVNGDTTAVLTGAPSLTTTATAASPASTYPITLAVGTLTATNYSFTFANGILTVNQAVLTVAAQNASKSYGASNPAFTASYSGFVNGDTQGNAITGSPSLTTTATAISPVNTYPIAAAVGSLAATNYSFAFVNGTLTVSQAVLTVTGQNASRLFGVANPAFAAAYSGFVNGDTSAVLTGAPNLTTPATTSSSVGTYPIAAGAGTLAATNYTFTLVNATLTVSQATPVITWANPAAIMFGNALSGAQLNATASVAGTFAYTPVAGTIPPVGTDTLSVTFNPADTVDYVAATAAVSLTVNQANTTITVTSSVSPSVPGASVVFTATVTSGPSTPNGSVGFMDGNITLGTSTLNASGVATFSTSALSAGTHSIAAVYGANGNYLTSTSPVLTQLVQQLVNITLTSSGSPMQPGSSVTFTATVSGGSIVPTGTVAFMDGNAVLGTGTLNGLGSVAFSTSSLALGMHTITVSYGGDADSSAGTSGVLAQLVQQVTITALASGNNVALFGSNVTFVAAVIGGNVTPTGSVTFMDGPNTLGSGTLSVNGSVLFSTTALSLGVHTITAVYTGDTNSQTSTSSVYSQSIQESTVATVTSSLNPSTAGTSVTFTASVTTPGPGSPTGSVSFLNGTTMLGSATLNGSSKATLTTSGLPTGPQSITAVYSGDSTDVGSTSTALTQNVQALTGTTPLTSSSNPSVSGQSVTFTATVLPSGSFTPTGMITFEDNGTTLGTVSLSPNGSAASASYSTPTLTPGVHSITTVYGGDSNNSASTSPALSQTVQATTIITLNTSGSPSLLGSSVTFSAMVPQGENGQPTGAVSFRNNGTVIGTGTLDGTGNTSLATSSLPLGSNAITAAYVGDALNAGSVSSTLNQDVREQTQLTILSSVNPSQPGASVTFTATAATTGPGTPTGNVSFSDGGVTLGTAALSTAGGIATATYTTTSLALGGHSITATYAGDTSNAPSTSPLLSQSVSQTTTVAITSTANPASAGSSVTLTATVTPANFSTPTGTVTFMDGNTNIGTGTLNGFGTASISLSNLAPAQHSITAQYSGDVNSNMSTSTIFIETIQQTTNTSLSVNLNPSISGASITLTATVSPAVSGTPTGSVTFMEGPTTLGSGTLNQSGVATMMIATLSLGSHSIDAVYAGDAVNLTSTSAVLTQTVDENTSMTLTASSNPVPAGTFDTFTATVNPGASGTPTGTVTFKDGNSILGTGMLNGSGVAIFATQSLGTGSHSILASYAGDSDDLPSTATLTLVVTQSASVITWATPSAVTFGTALGSAQLNATASVPGTFVYSPAAQTIPATGSDMLSVTFTPTDTTDYSITTSSVVLTVNKATPSITWATPAAITFGTGLGGAQLNATASAGGTFVYTPASGTVLTIGTTMLSVSFTPTDLADYNAVTASVQIAVNTAHLTVTANSATRVYGTANPSFAATVTGAVNGDTFTEVLSTSATVASAAGSYPITVSNVAGAQVADYIVTTANGTLTVSKAGSSVTLATSASGPVTQGASVVLTATVTSATTGVPSGSVTFLNNSTTLATVALSNGIAALTTTSLPVGTDKITANYTGDTSFASGNSNSITQDVGPPALLFVPVTPCRIADTRGANGLFGGPTLASGSTRNFAVPNSACGIPSTAAAYSLNVTVVPQQPLAYLTVWAAGATQPVVSTLNSTDGRIKANAAIVPAGTGGGVSIFVTDTTDVILDVNGYFVPSTGLAFYPVTPCRMVDTRGSVGSLAGPSMVGGEARTFPILSSTCNIPLTAQAYSLNFTAVPQGPLSYLTVWPAGQSQPGVSTLNAPTGSITANAAVVPAGANGSISAYATNNSDLIIDINGYFAPKGPGGVSLYTVTPCRVLDTRETGSGQPFSGTINVNVIGAGCGAPATAQAFVFNTTVVPTGGLSYLTAWAQGPTQPVVSTLNAPDGSVTSNMAVVPTNNGFVSVFATDYTQLILDFSGYFAP